MSAEEAPGEQLGLFPEPLIDPAHQELVFENVRRGSKGRRALPRPTQAELRARLEEETAEGPELPCGDCQVGQPCEPCLEEIRADWREFAEGFQALMDADEASTHPVRRPHSFRRLEQADE